MNNFKYSDSNKRYHTLDYFYKHKFNSKVFKVSLKAGFSCPNKDGTVGYGGCIYCSKLGSGDYAGDINTAVKVVFELKKFRREDYDVFSQYSECLKGCRSYWGDEIDTKLSRFISNAENILSQETIPVLIASDYNTEGLSGSRSGKIKTPWEALTGSEGVSFKPKENSAGSYGIGKNAPFACSSLSMVFYNTMAEDIKSAFIGVAKLATLNNANGEPTQSVGKYQCNDEEKKIWTPIFDSDENKFRDCFTRNEKGTDVIIVGFNQESNWVRNVIQAILKNFFVAISEGRLIVELKDGNDHKIINADSLSQLFTDYSLNNSDMIAASQLYKTFIKPDCKKNLQVLEPNDVEIYIKSDSSYKRTIANFRATGMLVGTYSKRIIQHYAAVVIVRGNKLGTLLKDTEPPKHNKWDYKLIESFDKEKRKEAKYAIHLIEDSVLKFLREQFETITADTVDAAGVGEYLPDDSDQVGEQSNGDDILKTKVKIGKIKTVKTMYGIMIHKAQSNEGSALEGDVHNDKKNPNSLPPMQEYPKPLTDDLNTQLGATLGDGTKTVRSPRLIAQRAFPIDTTQGIYKVIIKPAENCENMHIKFFAVGEDGKSDPLDIISFKHNGINVSISNREAGPISIKAETLAEFFVTFKEKEKMKLSLHWTEVVNK